MSTFPAVTTRTTFAPTGRSGLVHAAEAELRLPLSVAALFVLSASGGQWLVIWKMTAKLVGW